MDDKFNINRFVQAQLGCFDAVLHELRIGRKTNHWMWFIFPQMKGLGHSSTSQFYGLSGRDEALDYLNHPILGTRLRECCRIILDLATADARSIFGGIDSQKLRSSMTLFDAVCPNDIFADVLTKFFNNLKDRRTLSMLSSESTGVTESPLNKAFTPERIDSLGKNDIFVFGSNLAGMHGGGAARTALNKFGAVMGQGEGLQGNSYAIPTMHGGVEAIRPYVDKFIEFAKQEPTLTFYVTKIGCGIAGFKKKDIAPLFKDALNIPNIRLPKDFVEIISKDNVDNDVRNDMMAHAHGISRTFADLVIARNKEIGFQSPDEVISYIRDYFVTLSRRGDGGAVVAVILFYSILCTEDLFKDGHLDVKALNRIIMSQPTDGDELDKAYELHCREKLVNIVVFLNQFRRYQSADDVLSDLNSCVSNDYGDDPFSLFQAGGGYPFYSFERFLMDNWSKLIQKDGTLDPERLDEYMFKKHERVLKKYGLEAVLEHDYEFNECWNSFIPKNIGTGPVYIKLGNGGYAISCGDSQGAVSRYYDIPYYLEYTIASKILEDDSRYEKICGYLVPKEDLTLPILDLHGIDHSIINFPGLEEKRKFIAELKEQQRRF